MVNENNEVNHKNNVT